jgi:hypothetical protein
LLLKYPLSAPFLECACGWKSATFFVSGEEYVKISSVANTVRTTPIYRQTALSSKSNSLQSVENVVCDIATVAAKVAPVVGMLGLIIDIFV